MPSEGSRKIELAISFLLVAYLTSLECNCCNWWLAPWWLALPCGVPFWLNKESLAETKRRHHVPYHLIPSFRLAPLKSVLQISKFRTQFVGKRLGQTRKPTNFRILNFQQLSIALEQSDVDGY